jgi:hypothetical protein
MDVSFSFKGEMWIFEGNAAWCFITLPKENAEDIKLITQPTIKRGFGSVRVKATIRNITWQTSIFPDKQSGSYVLPIKKEIRNSCGIQPGETANVEIALADY